ncbi:MAG: hypothetical protein AB7I38_18485 [Dehalococcoidia bacterium]
MATGRAAARRAPTAGVAASPATLAVRTLDRESLNGGFLMYTVAQPLQKAAAGAAFTRPRASGSARRP